MPTLEDKIDELLTLLKSGQVIVIQQSPGTVGTKKKQTTVNPVNELLKNLQRKHSKKQ